MYPYKPEVKGNLNINSRREVIVTTKAEIGVTQPQAQEYQQPSEAEGGKEGSHP